MNRELRTEVDRRVHVMLNDPAFMEDNDNPELPELEMIALEDIVSLGGDQGGNFHFGIAPTIVRADGTVDQEAMRAQSSWLANERRDHAEWKRIYRAACRELARRERESCTN